MERGTLFLSPEIVEEAEQERAKGKVLEAASLAANGLDFFDNSFSIEEVNEIIGDPTRLAVLFCLTNIYVDSLKSAANSRIDPKIVLEHLTKAGVGIEAVYRDKRLIRGVRRVEKDHLGREHFFWAESARHEAKVMQAAASMYSSKNQQMLLNTGAELLKRTYDSLADSVPVKPLIGIEMALIKASRGGRFDAFELIEQFNEIVRLYQESNPHRVATVASWLSVWGEKVGDSSVHVLGKNKLGELVKKYPDWAFMEKSERRKHAMNRLRSMVLRVLSPLTTNKSARDYLLHLLVNQTQNRFAGK